MDWDCLEVEGASGGILLLWEKKVVQKNDVAKGLFSLLCKFRCLEGNFEWMFYGVYGPNLDQKQAMLWGSWLAFTIVGNFHGVSGEILM